MTNDQHSDGLPPLLSDERIAKINDEYGFRDGFTGFARAVESEVRAPLLAELAALRAEVEALRVDAGWRPISEAPKDGTEVLLYGAWAGEINGMCDDPCYAIGFWDGGKSDYGSEGWWSLTGGDAYATWMFATHWRPLPAPPAIDQSMEKTR